MEIEKEFTDLKQVVKEAGQLARDYFYSDVNPAVQKDDGSLVTEIDKAVETKLRSHIEARFPDDTIVGEEDDTKVGTSGYVWFIDPIDGTDNFVRKIPVFAVTVTRLGAGPEDSFAIVYNPISEQLFASLMEDGSYENDNLCNLTADPIGSRYLIYVGASSSKEPWSRSAKYRLFDGLHEKYGISGTLGCSLLQFAYVAAGRADGNFCFALDPWDSAAGLYLVKAAGGVISRYTENGWERYDGPIKDLYGSKYNERPMVFVSHPDIHAEVANFVGNLRDWSEG